MRIARLDAQGRPQGLELGDDPRVRADDVGAMARGMRGELKERRGVVAGQRAGARRAPLDDVGSAVVQERHALAGAHVGRHRQGQLGRPPMKIGEGQSRCSGDDGGYVRRAPTLIVEDIAEGFHTFPGQSFVRAMPHRRRCRDAELAGALPSGR